jgi:hypothetical protein
VKRDDHELTRICGAAANRVGFVILSAVSSALGGHARLCDLVQHDAPPYGRAPATGPRPGRRSRRRRFEPFGF